MTSIRTSSSKAKRADIRPARLANLLSDLRQENLASESSAPLHQVIRRHIQNVLASKAVKPGEQIPTEQEIMAIFSVSRITVRQAIGQLVASGALVTRRGRGTFVAQPRISHQLKKLTGFVEDMDALGLKATSRVVSVAHARAGPREAEKLNLTEGTEITRIERLRLGNNEPLSFDISVMPADIGKRIASENLAIDPIFSLLENKYGIKLAEADYAIEASLASASIARQLQVQKGSPLLMIERVTYSTSKRPIDYETIYYRGDRIRYLTTLKR